MLLALQQPSSSYVLEPTDRVTFNEIVHTFILFYKDINSNAHMLTYTHCTELLLTSSCAHIQYCAPCSMLAIIGLLLLHNTYDTVLLVLIVLDLTLVGSACCRTHCATVLRVTIVRVLTLVGSTFCRTSLHCADIPAFRYQFTTCSSVSPGVVSATAHQDITYTCML